MTKIEIDKDYLKKAFIDRNLSSRKIAEELGIHHTTVLKRIKEYNLKKSTIKPLSANSSKKPLIETQEQQIVKELAKNNFSPQQLKEFIQGLSKQKSSQSEEYFIGKNYVKIGVSGDYHFGNINVDYKLIEHYIKTTKKEKVDLHLNLGDIFDGWYQNRPSSIFEQDAIGFDRQMDLAAKWLSKLDAPLYFITGNHSYNTFVRGAGIEAGPYLEDKLKLAGNEAHYLGNAEGDIQIGKGCTIKLMHPDGGTAYALSYKPQKIIESLESGLKPNILLIGHFHKMEQLFYRNVHAFQTGTMMGQTKFMRGKQIPAHKGFYILDVFSNDKGQVDKIVTQLYPSYK